MVPCYRRTYVSLVVNRLTLLLLLVVVWADARAQRVDLRFERLTVEEGLPQTFVASIARDSLGFIWFGTAGGLTRFDGYQFDVFQPDPDDPTSLQGIVIDDLLTARDGTVWVGTDAAGLSRFVPETQSFHQIPVGSPDETHLPAERIYDLLEDDEGHIWVARIRGLSRLNPTTEQLGHIAFGANHDVTALDQTDDGEVVAAVFGRGLVRVQKDLSLEWSDVDLGQSLVHEMLHENGRLWLATSEGLAAYDLEADVLTRFPAPELQGDVRALFPDTRSGWLWATTPDGFALFDTEQESVLTVRSNAPGNPLNLPSDPLNNVLYDRTGIFWVTSAGAGVAFTDFLTSRFARYRSRPGDAASLASSSIRSISSDSASIWVGLNSVGFNRIDRETGRVTRFPLPVRPPGLNWVPSPVNTVFAVNDMGDELWTLLQWGLERRDGVTGQLLETYSFPSRSYETVIPGFIHQARDGRFWVGGQFLSEFDPVTGAFSLAWPETTFATALHETASGDLWVTTYEGLARYVPSTGDLEWFRHNPDDPTSISNDQIISMWAESDSVLWLGTAAGVNRFDVATGESRRITSFNSPLPDNFINGVLEGVPGEIWVSTNGGLARIDIATGDVRPVGDDRGQQAREYNRGASHRGADGTLYFGGINGLNAFDPVRLRENPYPPLVHLRRLEADGEVIVRGPGQVEDGAEIRLRPGPSDLEVEYVGLHFAVPQENRYQVYLEGLEDDWGPITTSRTVRYRRLAPGRYTLHVRAANAYGVWSGDVALVTFVLPPPWWGSWWFRLLVVATVLGGMAVAYRWRTESMRVREQRLRLEVAARTQDLAREQARTEQQAEELLRLNQQQQQLFANVSHETRTPLTLILGPVEDALRDDLPAGLRGVLEGVRQNGRRLLYLVDKILDLARMEAGQTEFRPRRVDLGEVVRALAGAFETHAARREIGYTCSVPDARVISQADVALLEHVLFNLISNAIKFTPTGGKVRVSLTLEDDGATAAIRVRDTGSGIPPDLVNHIFDRFALADAGGQSSVGLGLAIVKEAVDLHGGAIEVASRLGFGTTFTVRLPVTDGDGPLARYASGDRLPALEDVEPPAPDLEADGDQTTVLVVEDSADVRGYVVSLLQDRYRVLEAGDGARGLEAAREHTPDLVVSDVSMPEMNGLELVAALKSDADLQFVPVILLTARAEVEDRVGGLEAGADDYLAKPFDARELRARVQNLIASRRAWREQFVPATLASVPDAFPEATSADDELRRRIEEAVHERFADPSFSARDLADAVGLSGSQLRRRTHDLLAATPTDLIRSYRLAQGAHQLAKRTGTVSEIAYAVGFNSVSYFTRSFRDAYDTTPTEYASSSVEDA